MRTCIGFRTGARTPISLMGKPVRGKPVGMSASRHTSVSLDGKPVRGKPVLGANPDIVESFCSCSGLVSAFRGFGGGVNDACSNFLRFDLCLLAAGVECAPPGVELALIFLGARKGDLIPAILCQLLLSSGQPGYMYETG